MPDVSMFPVLNATLNAAAAVCLLAGRIEVRRGNVTRHRRWMTGALLLSALFLASYLIYHYQVGSVRYEGAAWARTVYLLILIPHVVLATLQLPFIVAAVWAALRGNFSTHVRIVRWLWPVWIYVSLSGVAVFLMLYVLPHGNP